MAKAGKDLAIDVWQFVRIMVELEARAQKRRSRGPAFRAWKEAWAELDRSLTEIGARDAAAFAELMMDQQVVLPAPGEAELEDALAALDAVIAQLAAALGRGKGGTRRRADLQFERESLAELRTRLSRRLHAERADGRRPSRGSPER
jgi:hypothetical protein